MRIGHTRRTDSIDEATRRAQEEIHSVRLRAERDLERATKQATRTLERSRSTMREHPMMVGAIAGTAIVGGLAAWLLSRKRSQ
jgi:F0F1-type ATP synthase membrane subunit b/b'